MRAGPRGSLATDGVSLTDRAAGTGWVLAMSLATPGLLASAGLAVGQSLSPWVLPVTAVLLVLGAHRRDPRDAVWHLAGASVIIAVSCFVAASVFDLSFDGQTYHQVAVRALADGWNPVWNPRAPTSWAGGLYVESLPKAAWLLEAVWLRATGSLEVAKCVQFIAMAAAFLLGWPALELLGVRRRAATGIAALAAANPVALTQLLTFYVDGLVASTLTTVLALLALYARTRSRYWAVALVLMFAFLANLKLPATAWALLVAAVGIVFVAVRSRAIMRNALVLVTLAGGLTMLEGLNPFVTNAVNHGHPAFPAAGPEAIPNAVHFDPTFAAQSRLVQLTRSLLSRSSDNDSQPPRLKIPLSLHAEEFAAFTTVDTRIGGWGPLFGGALLWAWVVLVVGVAAGSPRAQTLALLSSTVAVSALLIPFGHYSRYAPHLWLAAVAALLVEDLRTRRTKLLALVLVANLMIVAGASIGAQVLHDRLHRAQLRGVARDARGGEIAIARLGPFVNVDLHLRAFGIRYRTTEFPPCDRPARLLKTHALICLPGGRSPQPEPNPLALLKATINR